MLFLNSLVAIEEQQITVRKKYNENVFHSIVLYFQTPCIFNGVDPDTSQIAVKVYCHYKHLAIMSQRCRGGSLFVCTLFKDAF
jgi:hypothetical protein